MPRPKNIKSGEIFCQTPVKNKKTGEVELIVPFNNSDGVRVERKFFVFFSTETNQPEIREGEIK